MKIRRRLSPITRAKLKLRCAMAMLDAAIVAGGVVRRGLINLASAFVAEATYEVRQAGAARAASGQQPIGRDNPGASGTARKVPGAASSGAASRRTARAPQLAAAER